MDIFIFIGAIINLVVILIVLAQLSSISQNTKATARIIAAAFDNEMEDFIKKMEENDMEHVSKKLVKSIHSLW